MKLIFLIDKNNTIQNSSNRNTQKNYQDVPYTNEVMDSRKNSSSMSSPYSYLNEDQLKYFTYVLIKNFEVNKIDYKTLRQNFFKDEYENLPMDTLSKHLENHIISLLNITNSNDKNNVLLYTKSIIRYNNNDYNELKTSFLAFFEIIKIYSEEEENKLKKKLIKVNKFKLLEYLT